MNEKSHHNRSSGSVLLVVLVLIAVVGVMVVSNSIVLRQFERELELIERRQMEKYEPVKPVDAPKPARKAVGLLRGCSGLADLAEAKIPRRRIPTES